MVRNGIDRLESQLDTLRRLRVGVITNHTGLTAAREPLVDLLRRLGITIGALFSPEHGIRGQLDETVPDGVDERTGLPIYSLYGERKKPTPQQMFNTERGIGADLKVIPCEGWKRSMLYDACGLYWTKPSPNMRRLQQAFLYIGIGVWEGTNLSVGRGTDTPFELVGAPWIDGRALAGMLNELPTSAGVRVVPIVFMPTSSVYKGVECQGVSIFITNREQLRPFAFGIGLAYCLRKLYPREWEAHKSLGLLANREVHAMVLDGAEPERILQRCARDEDAFRRRREPFLRYG
jgi:uncharacterized protein YbbC (DUF1343 family)